MTTNGTIIREHILPPEQRLAVLEDRRLAVLREREGYIIDHRVRKALGDGPELLKSIEDGLARCERALDVLEQLRVEIEGERA